MVKFSRQFDEGKSSKKSFKNLSYGSQKTVSNHLNICQIRLNSLLRCSQTSELRLMQTVIVIGIGLWPKGVLRCISDGNVRSPFWGLKFAI